MGEYRTTRGEKPPATVRERRSNRKRIVAAATLLLGLLVAAGYVIRLERRVPASGYVTTTLYSEVRAPLAGRVTRIAASSGERIAAGALLVQLEDTAERAAAAEAERDARRAEAELAWRESELAEARRERACRIETAKLALEHAGQQLDITRQLSEKGLAAGRDLGEATFKVKLAEAELRRLQETDATVDERQIEVLRQALASRREALAAAQAAVADRAIVAPLAGRLLRHTFYAGEVVRPDMVLYEIFGGDELILKLRVPERYATRVATNQLVRAQLRSDKALLPHWLHGRVAAVRDAIQVDGAQTYRLVYCPFDPAGREAPPGTTADAQIRVGRASLWDVVFDL